MTLQHSDFTEDQVELLLCVSDLNRNYFRASTVDPRTAWLWAVWAHLYTDFFSFS